MRGGWQESNREKLGDSLILIEHYLLIVKAGFGKRESWTHHAAGCKANFSPLPFLTALEMSLPGFAQSSPLVIGKVLLDNPRLKCRLLRTCLTRDQGHFQPRNITRKVS